MTYRVENRPGKGDVVSLRASGLADLFDDSLRFAAVTFDKRRTKTYGRSHLGTSIHWGTQQFDAGRMDGQQPITENEAVHQFVQYLRADDDVTWEDIRRDDAEKIGIRLVAEYCQEIAPQFEFVAVETTCEPLEIEMRNGIIFEITGHVDRVRHRKGRYGICDLKSGYGVIGQDGEVHADAHGVQLAIYELLETMATTTMSFPITLPAVVIALSTRSAEIKWVEVKNPRNLLFGNKNFMGYLDAASKIIEGEIYVGNPRSMLCTDRFCPIYDECFYRVGANRE